MAARPAPEPDVCPHCGSSNLFEVSCTVGPHHARLGCSDCKRHIKFLAAPWTLDRAKSFTVPFGMHKGRSVGDLARSEDGRGYLRWAARKWDGNAGIAVKIVLGLLEPEEATR